jgi:hypothetical protein
MDAKMMKDVYDMVACDATGGEEPYCLTTGNGSVQTLFPRFNLVDPTINNETMYALRMADEMVRSRRLIQSTVGTPPTDYNLNDDEVVLAQSQLATYKNNPENTVWDTAKPSLHSAGAADAAKMVQGCILKSNGRFTSPWKTVFPKKTTEIVFKKSCTFTPLMFLAKLHSQSAAPMSESAVRRVLWKAYKSLFDQHQPVLLELLNTTTPEQVEERVLRSTTYQLSDVDWWVFCQHGHIPAFLFWNDPLPENWLRLYTDNTANTAFWFIRKERGGKYSIVSTAYALSALTLSTLKDDQGRLILQQI